MFFYLSKIFWFFTAPANLLLATFVLASLALLFNWWRTGRLLLFTGTIAFVLAGFLPLHAWLLRPLEDRFPIPDLTGKKIAGIIVLGGAVDQMTTFSRGPVQLTESGSRMTEAAALALRFPDARLVFSGGSASITGSAHSEADAAKKLYLSLGIAPVRMTFESRSRNTYENAVFTRQMLKPTPGANWILVTSAFHMPRAVGIFRKAGFPVIPYPAEYRTAGVASDFWRPMREISLGLRLTDVGTREWVGLVAYYLSGRTSALFPAPVRPAAPGPGMAPAKNAPAQSLRGSPSR